MTPVVGACLCCTRVKREPNAPPQHPPPPPPPPPPARAHLDVHGERESNGQGPEGDRPHKSNHRAEEGLQSWQPVWEERTCSGRQVMHLHQCWLPILRRKVCCSSLQPLPDPPQTSSAPAHNDARDGCAEQHVGGSQQQALPEGQQVALVVHRHALVGSTCDTAMGAGSSWQAWRRSQNGVDMASTRCRLRLTKPCVCTPHLCPSGTWPGSPAGWQPTGGAGASGGRASLMHRPWAKRCRPQR